MVSELAIFSLLQLFMLFSALFLLSNRGLIRQLTLFQRLKNNEENKKFVGLIWKS